MIRVCFSSGKMKNFSFMLLVSRAADNAAVLSGGSASLFTDIICPLTVFEKPSYQIILSPVIV